MNRTYDRAWYLDRIAAIKRIIPNAGISTDIIAGFCGETEEEHQETVSMMKHVQYDLAYMYMYSERPGTLAAKRYADDVPEEVKKRRLQEIVALHREQCHASNRRDVGKLFEVLVEGYSKRSDEFLSGRNSQNKVCVFPKENANAGDYVMVRIHDCTAGTLIGTMEK
jgi:tRNA-2-methylthio-N6-dimethylallyladenosine synthase